MEKPTQLPFLFPVKYKLPAAATRQYLHSKARVFKLKVIHDDFDVRSVRNASNRPNRSKRSCIDAAAGGRTTNIPTSKDISSLQKIICRYIRKRPILTFPSAKYHGRNHGQKFLPYLAIRGSRQRHKSLGLVDCKIKIPDDHSTIITPFSRLIMVSWRTLAESDTAGFLNNM